jgi:hypothetical protein
MSTDKIDKLLNDSHPLFHISSCTKDIYHIYLNVGIEFSEDLKEELSKIFKDGFGTRSKPLKFNTLQLQNILKETNKIMEQFNLNHMNDDDEDCEDDEDNDEEIIQQVISRRLKSKSSQEVLEDDIINDSEDEDNITICRRLRYLISSINRLKNELKELKDNK